MSSTGDQYRVRRSNISGSDDDLRWTVFSSLSARDTSRKPVFRLTVADECLLQPNWFHASAMNNFFYYVSSEENVE